MNFYTGRSVYRYFSKIDESDDSPDFRTFEAARESDRALAILMLAERKPAYFADALRNGDGKLVKALRFLADQIEDAGRDSVANPQEQA